MVGTFPAACFNPRVPKSLIPLALAALCATCTALAPEVSRAQPAAAGRWCIEPGREGEVLGLLSPFGLTQPIVEGWTLANVRIQSFDIIVELSGPPPAQATLTLGPSDEPASGDPLSASFRGRRDGPPDAKAALDALAERVSANDQGGFWKKRCGRPAPPRPPPEPAAEAPPGPEPPPGPPLSPFYLALLGLGLLALIASAWRARGAGEHLPKTPVLAGVLGLAALAWALRAWLVPGPLPTCHSAHHAFLEASTPLVEQLWLLLDKAGADASTVLLEVSRAAGALWALPVALVAARLNPARVARAALVAALVCATLPDFILAAGSYGLGPLATLLALSALAAGLLDGRATPLAATLAGLAVAIDPAQVIVAVPLVALRGGAIAALVAVLATGLTLALDGEGADLGGWVSGAPDAIGAHISALGDDHVLGRLPPWLPLVLLVIAARPAASGLERPRLVWLLWWLLASLVLLARAPQGPHGTLAFVSPLQLPLVLAAAGLVAHALAHGDARWRFAGLALVVVIAATPFLHRAALTLPDRSHGEADFLATSLDAIPEGAFVYALGSPADEGTCCPSAYRALARAARHRADLTVLPWDPDAVAARFEASPSSRIFAYAGVSCARYHDSAPGCDPRQEANGDLFVTTHTFVTARTRYTCVADAFDDYARDLLQVFELGPTR